MDSFEFNKLIGALLGTVFVVFSVGIVSDAIFAAPASRKARLRHRGAEPEAGGGGEAAPAEEADRRPAGHRQSRGRRSRVQEVRACHTGENGGANKVGPNLWDIVNRPVASHEGFAYSAADEGILPGRHRWSGTTTTSNHFLPSPKGLVKGTAMGFAGVKKPDERANLIAYLRTLSDSPAPLPEAPAPAAERGRARPSAAPAAGRAPRRPKLRPAEPAPAPAEPAPAPAQ